MSPKEFPFNELANLQKLAEFYDQQVLRGGLPSLVDHWKRLAGNVRDQLEQKRRELQQCLLTAGTRE